MKNTVVFKTVENCSIKGDFYPTSIANAPVLVYIHGGGLIWGSREDMPKHQIDYFNEAGFNVFTIDYRLAPETKVIEIKKDIEDAIIWLEENGTEQFDIDVSKIAVMGSSAGGYLALLSGVFTKKPKAIVSLYGYGDITGDWYMKPSSFFLQKPQVPKNLAYQLISPTVLSEGPIEKRYAIYLYCRQQGAWLQEATGMDPYIQKQEIQSLCPYYLADRDYPPTLLIHGDSDTDVPYEESVKMNQKLTDNGVESKLITIKGGDHVFDEHWNDSQVQQTFEEIIGFLKEKLV
ncbi:alpha/beta hydrolase [Ornithinibacillus halophilus]|uniref:Acetyl esterase/lipase n=1 Tax=Ornithinibacillus halophilus TaxID=930117 RepID=A0A1M5MQN9_9BACI|nr:alpha/beta hydrolase [Ornithinibacillus halophilus]SHG79621.1 Acetyl esterase/lipase [Ornithinibacillus halophilus]